MAVKVLPPPVAIWSKARSRPSQMLASRFSTARIWAGHMPARLSCWANRIRPLRVAANGAPGLPERRRTSALNHPPRVSGRWKLNTRRAVGSGSNPLVKNVSTPVLSYRNGSGRTGTCSPERVSLA